MLQDIECEILFIPGQKGWNIQLRMSSRVCIHDVPCDRNRMHLLDSLKLKENRFIQWSTTPQTLT